MSDVAAGYDAIAEAYAERFADELQHKPLDRALLDVLAHETGAGATVGDVGCGPGQITAYLHERGLRMVGVDLSPGMIAAARRRVPGPDFAVGSMLELPIADQALAGCIALYSVIHIAPADRPRAFAELRRVLRDGAPLLVAFHVGDEVRHFDELYGQRVSLDFHFLPIAEVVQHLETAGFTVAMTMERAPYTAVEAPTRRGYILARAA